MLLLDADVSYNAEENSNFSFVKYVRIRGGHEDWESKGKDLIFKYEEVYDTQIMKWVRNFSKFNLFLDPIPLAAYVTRGRMGQSFHSFLCTVQNFFFSEGWQSHQTNFVFASPTSHLNMKLMSDDE